MDEMASQVIGGAVCELQALEINSFQFARLPCLHGNLDSCCGRNARGEDRTNKHDIHAVAIYRDTKIAGHAPYNLAQECQHFFYKREQSVCRNHGSPS